VSNAYSCATPVGTSPGSAFFRSNKLQPPKTDATPPPPPAVKKSITPEVKVASKKASIPASVLAYNESIEVIRKSVKHPGKEVTFVRLTQEEKAQLGDIVYTYKKQGIKTSENEIARIGLNQLIEDYNANGQNSILAKVIKALNDCYRASMLASIYSLWINCPT
jgi:hypothetical protein